VIKAAAYSILSVCLSASAAEAQDKVKPKNEPGREEILKELDRRLEAQRKELLKEVEKLLDARLGKDGKKQLHGHERDRRQLPPGLAKRRGHKTPPFAEKKRSTPEKGKKREGKGGRRDD
jgi:hypothetical protein